ncbi:hypothetical protein P4O66_003417 [Electrophorus voltai]|uniref:Uncharacterized protein n=1 Tax=Electrophorus voltai TaxID=2609070 RepID=A0AAD9DLF6_9TELE|nr:hypothetical protein P4O66_003417 [Electrophorus voltai]
MDTRLLSDTMGGEPGARSPEETSAARLRLAKGCESEGQWRETEPAEAMEDVETKMSRAPAGRNERSEEERPWGGEGRPSRGVTEERRGASVRIDGYKRSVNELLILEESTLRPGQRGNTPRRPAAIDPGVTHSASRARAHTSAQPIHGALRESHRSTE